MSSDSRDRVHYLIDLGFGPFRARRVLGEEGLSRPSRFEVRVRIPDAVSHNPEDMIGKNAMIAIVRGEEASWLDPRRLLVLSVADLSFSLSATGRSEVWALLESRLGRLRLRTDFRVFRDKTVPEIVEDVLGRHQIGVVRRLSREYVRRPYTVQFRETDLDFVHRLLEDEGIHYVCLDGERQDERVNPETIEQKIQLGDTPGSYDELPGGERVPFRDATALERDEEFVSELAEVATMMPSTVTVRDFSVDRPSLDLAATARVPRSTSGREHYEWASGFELPDLGARRAADRAEAFAAAAATLTGAAELTVLAPARTFEPEGGPAGSHQGRLVATALRHDVVRGEGAGKGNGGGGKPTPTDRYRIEFDALPADVIFRPLATTPKPKIDGFLEAFVCGPEGADIHTDAMGRIKVRFPWDRTQDPGADVSHWVPVLQDNTGQAGAIPRVDWEVLCGFAEGDPDRPVAVGRLYNARDPFPTQLPAGKTKTALRTLSSPGRDGENAIWIDDAAGSELISVVAEKDQRIEVENDRAEKVVGNEKTTIMKDETVRIGRDRDTRVQGEHAATVSGNQTIAVGGSHKLEIGAGYKSEIDGNRSLSVGTMHFRKIGGQDDVAVTGSLSELIGGVVFEASLKKNERAAGIVSTLTVGGAIVELSLREKAEQTEMLRHENVFGTYVSTALVEQARALNLTRVSNHQSLSMTSATGDVTIEATGEAVPPLTIDIKGTGSLKAKELVIASGDHTVTITASSIDFVSKMNVVFEGVEGGTASLLSKEATITKA